MKKQTWENDLWAYRKYFKNDEGYRYVELFISLLLSNYKGKIFLYPSPDTKNELREKIDDRLPTMQHNGSCRFWDNGECTCRLEEQRKETIFNLLSLFTSTMREIIGNDDDLLGFNKQDDYVKWLKGKIRNELHHELLEKLKRL